MSADSEPARWEVRGRKKILQTRVFDVESVRFHHPRRAVEREFVVIAAPDWCNVVAVTRDSKIVLVRQFRYGTNEFSLEIPGGVIEKGEEPLAAGLRELREESGYGGGKAQVLGFVHPNPAIQNNHCHLVLVTDVEISGTVGWDPDEELSVITAPVEDVLAWARAGEITHSLTLCGLFKFEAHWQKSR